LSTTKAVNKPNIDEANLADGKNLPKKNLGKPSNLLVQKLYKYSNYGLMGQIPNARMHNWWDRSILISTVLKKDTLLQARDILYGG